MATESFFSSASLAYLASAGAGKDGKTYSIKPTDGTGDFTFSRGSNLAATRVGADGLIEKGRENLWLQSTDLGTSPNATTSAASITGGQSGYDGSSNAWELESLSDGFYRRLYQSTTQTGVITFSIYAKAANTSSLLIYNNQNGHRAWFDLSSGSLGVLNGAIDSSIEDIGSGWYRCSISLLTSASSEFWISPTNGDNVASCDLGNSILLQDAQLEIGLAATEVISTGATTGKAGLLEQEPRFDYSGGASCPSLLFEPLRTNNIPQSEYLSDSSVWAQLETIATQNEAISPEGLQNASKLLCVSGFANHQIDAMNVSISSGAVAGSVYAKKGANADWLRLRLSGTSNPPRAWFDLQNGVVGSVDATGTASIEDVGNGWYRCSLTEAGNTASGGGGRLQIFINKSDSQTQFTSNGDEYHYIYGAQMEAGSYVTSYIPTYVSSVTRSTEQAVSNQFQSKGIISSTQGTIFFDVKEIYGTAVSWNIQNEGSLEYALRVQFRADGAIWFQKTPAAQTTIRSITGITPSGYKMAMSWNGTNLISSFNGTSYIDTIDASIASQLNQILRPNINSVSVPTNKILVFPTQLTEAELNALTTI